MKTYVIATGVLFGILTLLHLWRIVEEPHLASDPSFILLTVVAAALCMRAWIRWADAEDRWVAGFFQPIGGIS